jgi:hypothetical protein
MNTPFVSFATVSRLAGLLTEARGTNDLFGLREINERRDGRVVGTGKHEYFCWHCSAEAAPAHWDIRHEPHCLIARIDAALQACSADQPSPEHVK